MRVLNFIWRIPTKIIKSAVSPSDLEPRAATAKMPRRRPLHTCAASCLVIGHKAFSKLQDLDGPLGSTAKRAIAIFASSFPLLHSMLYQWLALLSIIDDHILTLESKIEMIFPPSSLLFDKVDGLVCRADALPEQLLDVFGKFHSKMHQFPLVDWVLVHLISWLNFLLSILTHWGSKNAREKEITIDVNCNDVRTSGRESEDIADRCVVKSFAGDDQSAPLEDEAIAARNHNEHEKSYCDAVKSRAEPPKSVQFEDVEKPRENANAATESVHEIGDAAARTNAEPAKAVPSEVIHLSVKRLHSWKSRIKALEEPLYAGDSPMYSSYQSANSSPVSDCSQDEAYPHPANQTGKAENVSCTYKEMLERGKKEDEEREEDGAHEAFPRVFVNGEKDERSAARIDHIDRVLDSN